MMIQKFKFFEGITENTFVIDIDTRHVDAVERTLRVVWNRETENELNEYHGIDVETELSRLISENISREIDNSLVSILNDVMINDEEVVRGIEALNNNDWRDYFNRWVNIGNENRA